MQSTISHGPEYFRFESFQHWHDHGTAFGNSKEAKLTNAIYVDARGRICTRSSHYLRARDEGTFPILVYAIDEE